MPVWPSNAAGSASEQVIRASRPLFVTNWTHASILGSIEPGLKWPSAMYRLASATVIESSACCPGVPKFRQTFSTAVEITSVVRASESSFQVRWIERNYANGSPSGTERWTAMLSVVLQPPRTEERLRKNPLGIYVNGLSWSRELDATEGVKKP